MNVQAISDSLSLKENVEVTGFVKTNSELAKLALYLTPNLHVRK